MSQSTNRAIPATKRVILNDASQLPSDYSSTPGGTLFSTTPGGTRIIYDRAFLMKCRTSPLAKSPPANMANIPGVTSPLASSSTSETVRHSIPEERPAKQTAHTETTEEPQFHMDI